MHQTRRLYPAKSLLLEHIHPKSNDKVIILEGGGGWLAYEVASSIPEGQVYTHDRDIRHIKKAQHYLRNLQNAYSIPRALPKVEDSDLVLLSIPKERSFARLLLISSFQALKFGGKLLLAGPSAGGAKAVIKDAHRLFGNVVVSGYRGHHRVAQCKKDKETIETLPEEFKKAGICPNSNHYIQFENQNGRLILETSPGIFSWKKIDEGTKFLLENINIESGTDVWDVGCGYGIVGLSTAISGASTVFLSDTNILATMYTRKNSKKNNLSEKTRVFECENLNPPGFNDDFDKVDLIISNPAFHQGKQVDKSMANHMITNASKYLKPGGRLILVANRFINYQHKMRTRFKNVKIISENRYYHIIEGWNL